MWTAANRKSYERKGLRYPSDMTDAEWALVKPLVDVPQRGQGRRRRVDLREVLNAVFWQGGQPDHRRRRQPERQERRKGGKTPDPIGYDAGKKIKGRKRHAVVDTLGLMLGVAILPANIWIGRAPAQELVALASAAALQGSSPSYTSLRGF